MGTLRALFFLVRGLLTGRAALALENLALRQQLAVLRHSVKRPSLHRHDRVFWVWLSMLWRDWRKCLVLVQPETVITWHRQGFNIHWHWKSRNQVPGRPKIERELRDLIRRMSKEDPTWGAPRIQSEICLLGLDVAESTVSKYRDAVYGEWFRRRVKHMGIDEVVITPRSPWENPFAERVIGSIRRIQPDQNGRSKGAKRERAMNKKGPANTGQTVCSQGLVKWRPRWDSNPQHPDRQSGTLTN